MTPPAPVADRFRVLVGEYGPEPEALVVFEKAGGLSALWQRRVELPLVERGPTAFDVAWPARGSDAFDVARAARDPDALRFRFGRGGVPSAALLGAERLARRRFELRPGVPFRMRLRAPLAGLRRAAAAARPPDEPPRAAPSTLVDLQAVDASIRLSVPYATKDNFLGAAVYEEARAFLQRSVAEALARVHRSLARDGFGLLVFDAYRPWSVTKLFWDAAPDEARAFLADPAKGSRHNRGAAVDLTLCDLRTGAPVEMPSGFDELSPRAAAAYPGSTSRARWHRERLQAAMAAEGFTVHPLEWWHFDHATWREYAISNAPFAHL